MARPAFAAARIADVDVGPVMREAREARDWTQRQLARRVGVTASAISRYETGAQQPSLRLLERVLTACGRDLRLTLVDRHDDLQSTLTALAQAPYADRLPREGLSLAFFLDRTSLLGDALHVGGRWAAALHGLPTEPGDAVLTATDADADVEALAALLLRHYAQIEEEGRFFGLEVRPSTLLRHPRARWYVPDVGTVRTVLVPASEGRPEATVLRTPSGSLHLTPADRITSADGVQPEVLAVWRQWRTGRAHTAVPWRRALR
jgi:transcriptional regulator with XRE-family HTH domain